MYFSGGNGADTVDIEVVHAPNAATGPKQDSKPQNELVFTEKLQVSHNFICLQTNAFNGAYTFIFNREKFERAYKDPHFSPDISTKFYIPRTDHFSCEHAGDLAVPATVLSPLQHYTAKSER